MPAPRPQMLVVLNQKFWSAPTGAALRIKLLLEGYSRDYDIDLLFLRSLPKQDRQRLQETTPFVRFCHQIPAKIGVSLKHWKAVLKKFTSGELAAVVPHGSPVTCREWASSYALREILHQRRYDVLLVEYIWNTYLLNPITQAHLPASIWLDTHNVMYQRYESAKKIGVSRQQAMTADQEAELLRRYSKIIAIQPEEAEEFARLAPNKEIETIRVFPPAQLMPVAAPEAFVDGSIPILHVSACYPIAVGSLQWFLDEQWPDVLKACAAAHLHVVGTVNREIAPREYPGVTFHGFVQDLAPFYQHCRMVINPALAGSGLKIKSVEALAYGKTLITTDFGIQGIDRQAYPQSQLILSSKESLSKDINHELITRSAGRSQ